MLSSRPNEYGKQFLIRLIGISWAVHLGLLLLFFGIERWFNGGATRLSLKNSASRIRMISSAPRKGTPLGTAQQASSAQKSEVQQPTPATAVEELAPKKSESPKVPSKPPVVAKKIPEKKAVALPKKIAQKKEIPKKDSALKPKKESTKKGEPSMKAQPKEEIPKKKNEPTDKESKQVGREPKKGAVTHIESSAVSPQVGTEEGVEQEVNAAEAVWSPDEMVREFGRHFTIPEGFEDFEPFEMTYDTDAEGKVINISAHDKGPLVVYTAVKDAFLKSTMPQKNRKHIIWLIS